MGARVEERVEIKVTAAEKARFVHAAERRGVSLSDWVRRGLVQAADAELEMDEPPPPSEEEISEALKARGALRGRGLRKRVTKTRVTPWTMRR